jgi:excisionase family DNA binding protein
VVRTEIVTQALKKRRLLHRYTRRLSMTTTDKNNILSEGLQRISEAARFLGLSRSTIYKLINNGLLPSVKLGNSRRVPIRAVRELASDRLVLTPPPHTG